MNKVILMGRLTKDPEMRYTPSNNTPVVSFSIAVNRKFAKQGEEAQADFFNIVAWSKTAEFCNSYFKKGQQVAVTGRVQNRSYDNKEGQKVYITEIIADDVYFADSKKSGDAPANEYGSASVAKTEGFYPIEEGDDELPF